VSRNGDVTSCRACERLVAWRELIAKDKRRAYRDEAYWGRPVPGFGDRDASLVIVGLAPGAHGANRTGRAFTGDRSGDFLYAALHRAGVASQPTSTHRDDGLTLTGAFITMPCKCVPPDNRPTNEELARCRTWLERDLEELKNARAYLALGNIAFDAIASLAGAERARFQHGESIGVRDPRGGARPAQLFASYHVSQQNTQTGRLTPAMFDEVLRAALEGARRTY
jgi:uracil-DNA glycosylase family 4